MVAALLKFTQGLNVGDGQALVVSGGTAVDIDNHSNTGVESWTITLLYVPPGSALVPGVLAAATSPTPHTTVTPDVVGSYRIALQVVDSLGNVDNDIRVISVPTAHSGWIIPPYQHNPEQLPLTLKADEMNFGGQAFGWAGDGNGSRPLLFQILKALDTFSAAFTGINVIAVPITTVGAASTAQIPANAVVLLVIVNVETAYSAGATLEAGNSASPSAIFGTGTVDGGLGLVQPVFWAGGSAWGATPRAVEITVGGGPSLGAAAVYVFFAVPAT